MQSKYSRGKYEECRYEVGMPDAYLTTDKGFRWQFVDWWKDEPQKLPGIRKITKVPHGFIYTYKKEEKELAETTIDDLELILCGKFTAESVSTYLGRDDDSNGISSQVDSEKETSEDPWIVYIGRHFQNVDAEVVV